MRKIIIIGATSGIGRALTLKMARNGNRVGVTGRRTEMLESLCRDMPDDITAHAFDITSPGALAELDTLIQSIGGMDTLVFCAGTGHINKNLSYGPGEDTNRLNVEVFTKVLGFAYRYFADKGGGHIAAVTSVMGLRGSRDAPSYAASKSYQINYLEGLRQKAFAEKRKIIITDLRPGFVDTDMMKGEGEKMFWISSPDAAARSIARALQKERRVAYITPRWGLIGLLMRCIPGMLYERI